MKSAELDSFMKTCRMMKLTISKMPTWVDEGRTEGIEQVQGKFQSFWLKKGADGTIDRVYGEPAGEKIQKILDNLKEEKQEIKTDEKGKTQDIEDNKGKSGNEVQESKELEKVDKDVTLLPDFLTPALMSKWAKLSTTDRVLMFQKTPKDKIKSVAVGKDEHGVQQYASYVEGNFMFKEANAAFLFDWYVDDLVLTVCPTGVSAVGKLYCWFSEYNKYLTRPATGYQEINKKVDHEQAKKGATTDAIKKGLSLFGFNSDVYGGDV